MNIEIISHERVTYPSGTSYSVDPVQSEADQCGRQEVTIPGAIEAGMQGVAVYAYIPEQSEFGLDPWRLVDGIDIWKDGVTVDIWFASGACKTATISDIEYRFFITRLAA